MMPEPDLTLGIPLFKGSWFFLLISGFFSWGEFCYDRPRRIVSAHCLRHREMILNKRKFITRNKGLGASHHYLCWRCAKGRSGVTVLFQCTTTPHPDDAGTRVLIQPSRLCPPAGRQNHRFATCSPTTSPCNRSHHPLLYFYTGFF